MEPTNHVVLDEHLEKIVRDFNEFQRMSGGCRTDAIALEDLIDIYIASGGVNSPVDLNESQRALPPHQDQSAHVESTHGFNIDTEIQLSDIMTDEITEDMSQNDTGNFPDSSPTVNTYSHEGAGGSNSRVTRIRYGDLKVHGVADRIIGNCSAETVFHSVMKSFRTPGAGRKNLLQVHVKESSDGTTGRKYTKRKYKQIIETKEDIARQMEITTSENREPGAKARAKGEFLEGHEKINLPPEPLRRTISDPQHISFMDI